MDPTITNCPSCRRPAHAAESDDYGRCPLCRVADIFDGLQILALPVGNVIEARIELPRVDAEPHERQRGLAALHWLAAVVALATPDIAYWPVVVYHHDQLGAYRGAVIVDCGWGMRDAARGAIDAIACSVAEARA